MARDGQYRLLWASISSSKKIRAVEGKEVSGTKWWRIGCHLLYSWLVSYQDDDGRLRGRPGWVLENIVPYEGLTVDEVSEMLAELHNVTLIDWYEVDGDKFIQIIQGEEHQRIRKDRYKPSIYPPSPSMVASPTTEETTESQPDGSQKCDLSPSLSLSPSPSLSLSPSIVLANLLFDLIKLRNSKFKKPRMEGEDGWQDVIDKMIRLDNRTPEEIEEVIRWCQKDDFWQNNILSGSKLRTQFDQLWMKMKKGKPSGVKKQDGIDKGTQQLKDAISGKSKRIEHKP
jgi:hypothetical protein